MKYKPTVTTPEQWTARMFKLLYDASIPMGMGFLQARSVVSEGQVWDNICRSADYPGAQERAAENYKNLDFYADYVFGRMMKFSARIKDGEIEFRDGPYRIDYQSWCEKYPTPESIIEAVNASFS